jgi:hypothetical protein
MARFVQVKMFVKKKASLFKILMCIREFSSQRVQAGLFEVFEQASSFVPIPIHTIARSKRMMWHKGKEVMKEISSLAKVPQNRTPVKGKEIQKML